MTTHAEQRRTQAQAVALADRGLSRREIADRFGKSLAWVAWVLKDRGREPRLAVGQTLRILAEIRAGGNDSKVARRAHSPIDQVRAVRRVAEPLRLTG